MLLAPTTKHFELSPNNRVALKGLVSAHTKLGTADDAAEILEKAVADTPDDPELISMLAQTYARRRRRSWRRASHRSNDEGGCFKLSILYRGGRDFT